MSFLRPVSLRSPFVRSFSSLISPAKPVGGPRTIFSMPLKFHHFPRRDFSHAPALNRECNAMKKAGKIGLWVLLAGSLVSSLYASADSSTPTVVFSSKEALEKALEPHSLEEILDRMAANGSSKTIDFQFDESVAVQGAPLRNPGGGNLLKTEVYHTKTLTVFCPETPRVPHHLTIAFNRKEIKGLSGVSEEENREMFATIKKIAEVYNSISIQGFVIAQYDTPQEGHLGRCVVEIIPHLPGFNKVKNIADKMDCNRYVLFRTANFSPVKNKITDEEIGSQAHFWQTAFLKKHAPLECSDTSVVFPYTRKESHQAEAEEILFHQLLEFFQDKGAKVLNTDFFEPIMPKNIPEGVKSVTSAKCAFCDDAVIERQLVYEYEDISVFYNMRKGAKPGCCFLVLPKRHTEKVYGLNAHEIHNLGIVRKALVEVLKETHPEHEVIIYTQDDPSTGQTVFHSHEQVVAVNTQTIALSWTLLSLYPSGNVSDQEMFKVRQEFGQKLDQKIGEFSGF